MRRTGLRLCFLRRSLDLDAGADGGAGLVGPLSRRLSLVTSCNPGLCRAPGLSAAPLEEEGDDSTVKSDSFLSFFVM